MTEQLYLRQLGLADLELLYQIEQESFAKPWRKEDYAYEFSENALAHYYGCFCGPSLLAFAGFWQILDEAHITNIAVAPQHRRQGIAQLLVQHVVNMALAMGVEKITLEVREGNLSARRLYEKVGFAEAGRRKNYYDAPQEDAIIMWRDITLPLAQCPEEQG